jgi:RNA polymerase sigma-70 factor, ECF subfamily
MSIDWAHLYRSTFPELVRYVHRKVWDAERAHDLAQEAFLRGMDRGSEDDPRDPRGWLFTVAGNLARDEVRTVVRRRKHLTLIRAESSPADPAPDPLEAVERAERVERARQALEALGERDREVLLLWDAGLSYGQIAERTGLARGAVGTTLARARQRLNAAYRSLGAGEADTMTEEDDVARG